MWPIDLTAAVETPTSPQSSDPHVRKSSPRICPSIRFASLPVYIAEFSILLYFVYARSGLFDIQKELAAWLGKKTDYLLTFACLPPPHRRDMTSVNLNKI